MVPAEGVNINIMVGQATRGVKEGQVAGAMETPLSWVPDCPLLLSHPGGAVTWGSEGWYAVVQSDSGNGQ